MSITIDLPPTIIQEAKAFAENRHTTIEKMLLDSFKNEMKRQRELAEWEAEFDRLVADGASRLPQSPSPPFSGAPPTLPRREEEYRETGAWGHTHR